MSLMQYPGLHCRVHLVKQSHKWVITAVTFFSVCALTWHCKWCIPSSYHRHPSLMMKGNSTLFLKKWLCIKTPIAVTSAVVKKSEITQSSPTVSITFSQRTARYPGATGDGDASPGSEGDQETQATGTRGVLPSWQLLALPAECGSAGLPSLPEEMEGTLGS